MVHEGRAAILRDLDSVEEGAMKFNKKFHTWVSGSSEGNGVEENAAPWPAAGLHQGPSRRWQTASGAAERPHHPAGLWGQGRAGVRQGRQSADQDQALQGQPGSDLALGWLQGPGDGLGRAHGWPGRAVGRWRPTSDSIAGAGTDGSRLG